MNNLLLFYSNSSLMIILYIPFSREQAGDLSDLVSQWQVNHKKHYVETILVIYKGDEFDQDLIEPLSSVYICAHGYDSLPLVVGNHRIIEQAQCLNMVNLADRFNNDFLPVAHCLPYIHLYCCGNQEKNRALALSFKSNLLRPNANILFYKGMITIPDEKGQRWCFGGGTKIPIDNAFLYAQNYLSAEDDEPLFKRLSIKERDLLFWCDDARLKRIEEHQARQKSKRQDLFSLFRSRKKEEDNAVAPSPPELNNG